MLSQSACVPKPFTKPLPYQFLAFGNQYYLNLIFTYKPEELTLYYFHTRNDPDESPPPLSGVTLPDKTFKYVITAAEAVESMASAGVDTDDHDAVMQYLEQNFDVNEEYFIHR